MALTQHRREFVMTGTGYANFDIPRLGYKYVAIINANTNDRLELYQDVRTLASANVLESLYTASPFQNVTYMLDINKGNQFTLVWRDGGGSQEKRAIIIFAEENPNMNFQGSDGTVTGNMTLIGDNVGLVKASQLPSTLENGRLKVDIQDDISVQFPTNQNVTITNSIPTGNNKVGSVDVLNEVDVEITKPLPTGDNVIGKVEVTNPSSNPKTSLVPIPTMTGTGVTQQLPNIPCVAVFLQGVPTNDSQIQIRHFATDTTIAILAPAQGVVIPCQNADELSMNAGLTNTLVGFAEVIV